jgi:hypothetical protein
MPDYGHEIEFGYFLIPDAGDSDDVRVAPVVREALAGDKAA